MDRNFYRRFGAVQHSVALRKESVDRNTLSPESAPCEAVALRKESVDRNPGSHLVRNAQNGSLSARRAWIEILALGQHGTAAGSLSARRAWIEMPLLMAFICRVTVALRKESVDRNKSQIPSKVPSWLSLSARRAWIEISSKGRCESITQVALRKESVDRNPHLHQFEQGQQRRSPQGERG